MGRRVEEIIHLGYSGKVSFILMNIIETFSLLWLIHRFCEHAFQLLVQSGCYSY